MNAPTNTELLFATADRALLAPYGLDAGGLTQVFGRILAHQVDFADLYFQYSRSESWSLEEGIVKSGSFNIDQGVGVRAVSGEKTAFAYSDDISLPALRSAAEATRAIARQGGQARTRVARRNEGRSLYLPEDPLASLQDPRKVALLESVERHARARDPRIKQVIAEENGRREQGSAGGGGRFDYGYFTDEVLRDYVEKAAEQAIVNLDARPAPAGTMTVVLGSGWPGVLLHEAIGHGLEGDFNRKRSSAFSGRIGERVAAPGVTVVDDGTLHRRRGSLNIDDEGNPTQRTVLIEDGVLKTYMQDTLNARLMGVEVTGNGRRESFAHVPMPRMTNTYMLAGDKDPEEIIASVQRGLYAKNFGGGQVDIVSGKFVFSASEAYIIEDGRITYPVKGATLIGNGPDALTRVTMIGNDMSLDPGVGTCGKEGQSVPVGVGQPTLRIDGLTVGGTAS